MTVLAFIDTETTGLDADRHELWELAIILRASTGEEAELVWRFRPDLTVADPVALQLNRFYPRTVDLLPAGSRKAGEKWSDPAKTVPTVAEILAGVTLVGACPWFDAAFILKLLRAHGHMGAWHHRLRCVESMALGHIGTDVGGLAAVAASVGVKVPAEAPHTALGDARTVRAIWDRLVNP